MDALGDAERVDSHEEKRKARGNGLRSRERQKGVLRFGRRSLFGLHSLTRFKESSSAGMLPAHRYWPNGP